MRHGVGLYALALVMTLFIGETVSAAGEGAVSADPERPSRIGDHISLPEVGRAGHIRRHVDRMFVSPHAVLADERTPFAVGLPGQDEESPFGYRRGNMCFQCHGEGMETLFDTTDAETADPVRFNERCLSCHEEGARRHWVGSTHEFNGLACVNCHAMHNERPKLLKTETQLELCSQCHLDRRSDFNKPSHHPVPEGLMECTDCHNPHGTAGVRKLIGHTINETCYNCHAEKRGPFLWEHGPAREDCLSCHDPHGSLHRPLLTSRPPLLCQQCHLGTHSDLALVGGGPDFRIQGRSCLNCHSEVHGSNHPGGYFFTQ